LADGRFRVEVVDRGTGALVFDSTRPQRDGQPLAGGHKPVAAELSASAPVARATGNDNRWVVRVSPLAGGAGGGGLVPGAAGLLLAALLLVAGLGAILVFARRIVVGVRSYSVVAQELAAGDVSRRAEVTGNDELAELGRSLNTVADGLQELSDAAERVAGGDLSVDLQPRSDRDVLGHAFRRMVADLSALVGHITHSAASLSSSSSDVAAAAEQVSDSIGAMAAEAAHVADGATGQVRSVADAGELAGTITEDLAGRARDVATAAGSVSEAREVAVSGADAATRASAAMGAVRDASEELHAGIAALGAKSGRIGGFVEAITGLAAQTDLLALNAAIEAARAGEHGRGFAVVADEVRKLAETSAGSAERIGVLVEKVLGQIAGVAEAVGGTREAIVEGAEGADRAAGALRESITQVARLRAEIAEVAHLTAGAQEQNETIAGAVTRATDISEANAAVAEETAAATAQQLSSLEGVAASVKELSSLGGKMFELLKGGAQEPAAPPADGGAPPVVRFREIRPGAPA
ncbi:MAG: methyl-accepting chemotaxis protein, partial [Longimicrobiaceae bacterium]